jgi:alkanesulfonate monooxygenase SsuD/methylene tetrahydromethanopterin reductase-like flavin-dependent oxidoreductase (luciferase family)
MTRQLSLNAFIYPAGHHEAAWRHPTSAAERIYDASYYQEIARTAEAGTFDAVFFADGPALQGDVTHNAVGRLEPITLLTAIAAATERIGLIATASTTYYEPYNLARLFGSLDHISGGRAGWNIVTTGNDAAAANFGLDAHPTHAERYARPPSSWTPRWRCGTAGRTTPSCSTARRGSTQTARRSTRSGTPAGTCA